MRLETDRLVIRSIQRGDEKFFAEMAVAGSDYRMNGYVAEAVKAYTQFFFEHYNEAEIIATILDSNTPSWKTAEKAGFELIETKMYKDINDEVISVLCYEEKMIHSVSVKGEYRWK